MVNHLAVKRIDRLLAGHALDHDGESVIAANSTKAALSAWLREKTGSPHSSASKHSMVAAAIRLWLTSSRA